jgi:hypothetical protein
MSERMEYQVALLKDGRFTNYETPSLFVDTDDEAIEKAKDWAMRSNPLKRMHGFK